MMVVPDDSVSITNNTVGGSGPCARPQTGDRGQPAYPRDPHQHTLEPGQPRRAGGGYYTGSVDRTYTFTVACGEVAGCAVAAGNWRLSWSDGKGASGQLDFSATYQSPTFLPVGSMGVTLALYSGTVKN